MTFQKLPPFLSQQKTLQPRAAAVPWCPPRDLSSQLQAMLPVRGEQDASARTHTGAVTPGGQQGWGGSWGSSPRTLPWGLGGWIGDPRCSAGSPPLVQGEVCQPRSYVGSKTGTWGAAASWSEGLGWWLQLRCQLGGVPVGPQHLPDEELALLAHLCQAEVELSQGLVARQPFQQLLATVLQRVEERSPRVSEASPKAEGSQEKDGAGA